MRGGGEKNETNKYGDEEMKERSRLGNQKHDR